MKTRISATVDPDIRERFRESVKASGLVESNVIEMLMEHFIEANTEKPEATIKAGEKQAQPDPVDLRSYTDEPR